MFLLLLLVFLVQLLFLALPLVLLLGALAAAWCSCWGRSSSHSRCLFFISSSVVFSPACFFPEILELLVAICSSNSFLSCFKILSYFWYCIWCCRRCSCWYCHWCSCWCYSCWCCCCWCSCWCWFSS